MRLPNWLKIAWWLLLLTSLTVLLSNRLPAFLDGNANLIDAIAFIIWIALLLIPLFQEVSLFGISLKSEIKDVKKDVDQLRTAIRNSIEMRNTFSPSFYLPSPTPEAKLPELQTRIKQAIANELKDRGISSAEKIEESITVDEVTVYLFQARYNIEKELQRIWVEWIDVNNTKSRIPVYQKANELAIAGILDNWLAGAIQEIYSVASAAMHGKSVSERHLSFVKDIIPGVMNALRAVN